MLLLLRADPVISSFPLTFLWLWIKLEIKYPIVLTSLSRKIERRQTLEQSAALTVTESTGMAQEVFLSNQDAKTSDTFEEFLNRVQTETKEQVDNFLLPLISTAENERDSQNELSKQLEDALAQSDVVEVWKLIATINDTDSNKTLENINEVCTAIAERENNKENGCHFKCSWDCKKIYETIKNSICIFFKFMSPCDLDDIGGTKTEMRSEEERRWIEILSNPLYISLEWFWRNNPNSQYKEGIRRKESKFANIIEAALDDSYLLEKIASYEHYYSRDEHKRRAEEYETFAADIVGQVDTSDLNQLYEIMDIEGSGYLLNKTPANFNQSLGLLKLAADKKRKRVGI